MIDRLKIIADERGVIFEPLFLDCLPDQKNVHISLINLLIFEVVSRRNYE